METSKQFRFVDDRLFKITSQGTDSLQFSSVCVMWYSILNVEVVQVQNFGVHVRLSIAVSQNMIVKLDHSFLFVGLHFILRKFKLWHSGKNRSWSQNVTIVHSSINFFFCF